MQRPIALTWSWLNILSSKRTNMLLERFGTLEKAFDNLSESLLQELGCSEDVMMRALNRLEEFSPKEYEKELERRGLSFCSIEDECYPDALENIGDPPTFLYWKGDLSILELPSIGLVGSREMSPYGKRVVEHFVPSFVESGLITVSGLARGIDAEVAKETIHAGGKTVAILGNGLASVYPKSNEALAKKILESGGLIMSEFPLDIAPGKHTFPARNRIIAGLTVGTVVLEAAEGSGALITADLALDYGRDVFAVPGAIFDPNYAGCHEILSSGQAKLVTRPEQVLSEIGVHAVASESRRVFEPNSEEESVLFKALTTMPQHTDELIEKTALDMAVLNTTLTMLELSGAAKNIGEGKWVKSAA